MKRRKMGVVIALALASSAWAQTGTGGTISDGDVVFVQGDSPTVVTSTGPLGELRTLGPTAPDHVFQNWWWYRVDGVDTRENCLANASSGVWSGTTGTLTYNLGGFSAVVTYVVADQGNGAGEVTASMVITNTSGAPLNLQLFNYHDFDIQPNLGDDRAELVSTGRIRVFDAAGTSIGRFDAVDATSYQVGPFATLRGVLTNTSIDNLANTGLPFGPADFTGAYQWNLSLNPDEVRTVTARFGISPPAPTGRCCVGEGCSTVSEAECTAAGGVYAGDNTTCPDANYTSSTCSADFEDISSIGSQGPACDDCGVTVPIGFDFTFYGQTFSSIGIASNGYLTFGATLGDLSNDPIPATAVPNNLIAPYWDDLDPRTSPVLYAVIGEAGSRRFIAQWTNVPHFNSTTAFHTFQAVLHEGTNEIQFRYLLLPALGGVVSPSVGIEDATGSTGLAIDPATLVAPACVSFVRNTPNNPCASACACNWNGDSILNSQDFFDFLTGFFEENADFNDDGQTNSQDFFDFLTCFFAPPPGCK